MTIIVWYLDRISYSLKRRYFGNFKRFLYEHDDDFDRERVKDVSILGSKANVIDARMMMGRYPNLENLTLDYVCFNDVLFENCDAKIFDKIKSVQMGCYMLSQDEELLNDDDNCAKSILNIFNLFKNMSKFKFNGDPCSEILYALQYGLVNCNIQKFSFTSYEDDYSDDFIPYLIKSKNLTKVKLFGKSYRFENNVIIKDILHIVYDRNFKHHVTLFDLLNN